MNSTNSRLRKAMTEDRDKGFTLIELLVVIIIIGILAGVAIPVFLNQRKKGVDAGLKSDVKNAATTVETWITDYPQAAIPSVTVAAGTAAPTTPAATAPLAGFKASPGNTVELRPGTATGTYVIGAWNPNASTAITGDACVIYDSNAGGLQTAVADCTP